MKYQPKTTTTDRAFIAEYFNLNSLEKCTELLDDLTACEAALAEERKRNYELEAMVRELVEATEAEYHVVAGDKYHMLCPGSAIKVNVNHSWIVMATVERSAHRNKDIVQILNAARTEAITLLNQERKDGAK